MGGVINSVLKSGSNEFHGSAFGVLVALLAVRRTRTSITTVGGSLGYVRKPDFDTSIGVEVGGPIIKDKLFFWVGFAPRFQNTHVFRQTYAQLYDPTTMAARWLDANGNPISIENTVLARAHPRVAPDLLLRRRRSTSSRAPSTT